MGHCTVPADWQNYSQLSNVNLHPHDSNSFSSLLINAPLPSGDYHDVTELTWVNGQISMHGLGTPRVVIKPLSPATWDKARAGGTLESIVNQAANCLHPQPKFGGGDNTDKLLPLFEQNGAAAKPLTDALVPAWTLDTITNDKYQVRDGDPRAGCGSISESGTCGWRESQHVTPRTSMENTISADHSISHRNSRPTNKKTDDMEGKRKLSIGPSVSTKRSRAAAIHNQSERKRRDKINQRINTLQKMVPNSSKTDKASMLDEVIEYVKQLQGQVKMMSRMNMSSTMVPLLQQVQQLQMSMMGTMGMGVGMGMAMDMNTINRAATAAAVPPVNPPAAASMPASWNNPADNLPTAPLAQGPVMPDQLAALLGCQSQVTNVSTMDAYSRLAAMYQQMQQPPA